jgi:hypothetical protein
MIRRVGIWLAFALLILAPGIFQPSTLLLGDPRIDVWNHAWGYWFVAESIGSGQLPYQTDLVGGPSGGVLYFIDTPGALLSLPITWLFGPALAYNLVLLFRVAMAGFAAQLLCEELSESGPHTWLAGAAYATTPFLLCELSNGISEVCATQWLPLTLWAALRAIDRGRIRDWALLGLFQGLTSVATFYYGLSSALLVAALVGFHLIRRLLRDRSAGIQTLKGGALAGVCGGMLVLPHWMIFKASLADPGALIRREGQLNLQLMAHNAVDPRVYFTPGDFQSVDLAEVYGEPFIHTAYLRWTVLVLVGFAIWRGTARHRGWSLLALFSLVLGLGPYLWWGGTWVMMGEMKFSLPFEWLRQLTPELAITHPLRLSLGAQAICCALAGVGLHTLLKTIRLEARQLWTLVAGCALLCMGEGLFCSSASWPLPVADARVSDALKDAPEGMVLELPAEVGTTMETSIYFWHQTAHGRSIPYTPDVRLGSARDDQTFSAFRPPPSPDLQAATKERPSIPSGATAQHIRDTYGMIILHPDLEQRAGLSSSYVDAFTPVFGPPQDIDGMKIWRLR